MSAEHWRRWSALLDEVLDLDAPARAPWLAALAARDAAAASAVQRLLAREAETASTTISDLLRLETSSPGRGQFESTLLSVLTREETSDAAQTGQSFGPWQVSRKLGTGGMGEVWLAERADALYEGKAAIKLLRASGDTTRLTARFSRERQALARLAHPGIARLLDAGIAGSQPYLVLEYVRGTPLPEYAAARATTLMQRVQLALAIGRAVEYAHGRLIVHRDLKPSNVLVTAEGEVKLLDFGIASLIDEEHTDETSLTGLYGRGLTLDYAAPEQIAGEHTGVGADVFSLGVMLFELLTGERPFKPAKAGRAALEHAVLHQATPKPSSRTKGIRADLDAVVVKALQKSPEDRYPTMAAFVADLERWIEHRPVLAAQGNWRRDTALWLRRNRLAAGLSAAVIVSLVAGLSAALWQSREAQAAAARAEQQAKRATAMSRFMVDLFRAADPEKTKGAALTALDLLDAGATKLIAVAAEDDEFRAEIGAALGDTYVSLTRPDKGLPVLQRAVESAVAAYGPSDVRTARLQSVLALAEMQNEQYPESARRYAAAMPLLDAAGLGDAEDTLIARANWGYATAKSGDFDAAMLIHTESERRALARYGDQSWAYADAVNNTGTYYSIRSEWAKARDLFLSIEPITLRPPVGRLQDALTMRMNLANSLARTGEMRETLKRQPQIVADFTTLIGAEGNQTLVARWFLGDTYKRLGQYENCADEYTGLAEVRTRISGAAHPLTVDVVSKVAICRRQTGELDLSRDYEQRALAALTTKDDPPQRTTLRTVSTLANLAADRGDVVGLDPMLARIRALMAALKLQGRDDRIYEAMLGAHRELLRDDPVAALASVENARREAPSSMQYLHPEAHYAYVLALAGKHAEASAQLAKTRALATTQFEPGFQLFAVLDYVESLIPGSATATPQGRAAALRALAAAYPVPVKLPLSPIWFGLG
ncbi:MAG: serine/threonine-protein kinase [Pseudomonadota bacterium]